MATLIRRKTLKNGGASYGIEGARSAVRFDPKMFVDGVMPEQIELSDDLNLAGPDLKSAERAERAAERVALKEAREEAKAMREAARKIVTDARQKLRDSKAAA